MSLKDCCRVAGILSIALWGISLMLPAYGWGNEKSVSAGVMILAIGWLGIFSGQLAWLANLIIVPFGILVTFQKRPISAGWFVGVGVLLLFLLIQSVFSGSVHTPDGRYKVWVGPGYYIWNFSVGILAIALFVRSREDAVTP